MISHEYKVIFIHIPRTGGTSIEQAFGADNLWQSRPNEKHLSAKQARDLYGKKIWNEYFKFSFVRNPWSRIISLWKSGYYGNQVSLYDFLLHYRPASWEYRSSRYCDILDLELDFIGRFETIGPDYNKMCELIGKRKGRLPILQTSQHAHYSRYYDDETRWIVASLYRKDIRKYSYEFNADGPNPKRPRRLRQAKCLARFAFMRTSLGRRVLIFRDQLSETMNKILNRYLEYYWLARFKVFNPGKQQSKSFGIHLLITFYDEPDAGRLEEYECCLRWNIQNPYIKKIHVFYENRKNEISPLLKHAKVQVYDCRTEAPRTISYGRLFEFANDYLKSEIVAIANSDIHFDLSLRKLKRSDLSGQVLALTRYNRGIYGSYYCKIWERKSWSQDSWIFRSPLPDFNGNIYMGWRGCDNKLAYEMNKAGIVVTNPSQDIKTWHYHRISDRNYMRHNQSYLSESDFKVSSMHVPITKL